MLFENIAVLLPEGIRKHCWVATEGAKIASIAEGPPEGDFGQAYDGRGKLLMPGFVNAHSHAPMTLLRGYGENMALADWLEKRIFPFEARMTDDDIYWGSLLGIAEMLRFGITSTTDMYSNLPAIARAFDESGAKINMSYGIANFGGGPYAELPGRKEAHEAFRGFHGAADGRLRVDFSLHAEYTSNPETVRALAEDAKALGAGMHVHISETKAEHDACKQRHGKTPARYLADLGLLDVRATAAHCVWIEDADFDILRDKGVTVATCPKSNLKLASGVFDAARALRKGTAFAIGTDSVASNNNLNMLEEIRVFLLAQKGFSGDPTLITPMQAIRAATRAGALAQGRPDAGEITEGFRADLIVLDLSKPWMQPEHDLLNNVAYAAMGSDILLTMCDGKVLYRDGVYATIDVERAARKVAEAVERVVREV